MAGNSFAYIHSHVMRLRLQMYRSSTILTPDIAMAFSMDSEARARMECQIFAAIAHTHEELCSTKVAAHLQLHVAHHRGSDDLPFEARRHLLEFGVD